MSAVETVDTIETIEIIETTDDALLLLRGIARWLDDVLKLVPDRQIGLSRDDVERAAAAIRRAADHFAGAA